MPTLRTLDGKTGQVMFCSTAIIDGTSSRFWQVTTGRSLSSDDMTLKSLHTEGYVAVFLGMGLPDSRTSPMFQELNEAMGFYTSKCFLPRVAKASKAGAFFICIW